MSETCDASARAYVPCHGPMPTWTTRIGWQPDLLEVSDLSSVALEELLDLAARMKAEPAGWTAAMSGESLACVFEGPSARERVIAEASATARAEMDILNHRFVYFTDDGRGRVLYLRHDGDYGLVDPE
jgi:hypothetical protein